MPILLAPPPLHIDHALPRSLPVTIPSSSAPQPPYSPPSSAGKSTTMSGSSLWKTILLPPLFAALLYLLTTYLLLPLYRHHRRNHTSYLPLSTPSTARPPLLHRLLSLFSPFPSSRRPSLTPYLGDEELEEGLLSHHETRFPNHPTEHAVNTADDDVSSERRLSRELEGGFRDDSSSDGEERGRRPRRQ